MVKILEDDGEQMDDEEIKSALNTIITRLTQPDRSIREKLLPVWRAADFRWRGYNTIFWNSDAQNWEVPTRDQCEVIGADWESLNHSVNIYRAYGESVIGALSSAVPTVRFFPGDADNPNDITTAKAFTDIDKLIDRQNHAQLLLIKMLFTLWRQPFTAIYNHVHYSEEYGVRQEPVYGPELQEEISYSCMDCGLPVESPELEPVCMNCGSENIQTGIELVEKTVVVGYNDEPKSKVIIEVFGPLQVELPYFVTSQKCSPYLGLRIEEHISYLQSLYPDEELTGSTTDEDFEKWARTPIETDGEVNTDTNTHGRWWIRPWAFNILGKDDPRVEQLKQLFPKGVKVCKVGEKVVKYIQEELDAHWTVSMDPLSDHIHADPWGSPVINIQEMSDEILDLEMQTIEHGVPQTFASPKVLDFQEYDKQEIKVGSVFPAEPLPGQTLDNAFFTTKTATLSPEVSSIGSKLQSLGNLVSRAQPQIYGGKSGNETLGQDQQARQDALQRLGTLWKIVNNCWIDAKKRACMEWRDNQQEDEKFVTKVGDSYINTWIRLADMGGEVSHVEAEISEQFPVSWAQQRDILLQLLGLNNPMIMQAAGHPENLSYIANLFGLSKLYIPGEDDRNAQLRDILTLLQSDPLPPQPQLDNVGMPMLDQMMNPMMGPPQPTVPVDPRTANIPVRVEIVRVWANSDAGQLAKIENPGGYANVMAQLDQLLMYMPPPTPVETNESGKGLSTPAKDPLSVSVPGEV